jgi:iron(III) transport system ATP-binding protein
VTGSFADVTVRGLHKSFGRHAVLTGLDLTVPAGSFTAVLGPSGSGKTTLLRVLAGFERPDRGSVAIGGQVVDDERNHLPTERRRIGYVSQEGDLFPHLTVAANVGFGLPRAQRKDGRIADLLESLGLAGLGQRYPHQLSGGQQQRVAVARALAVEPSVVLLDEPFAALDATLRASVRADVHAILRSAGATAILVTHDQDEALSMADQVAVVRAGRVAQAAAPLELYSHPVDTDLARFVGDANLIGGTFDGEQVVTGLGLLAVSGPAPLPSPPAPVTVLVRPEQLSIGMAGQFAVSAEVVRSHFHGHDALVQVSPRGDGLPATLVGRVLGGSPHEPGETVSLTVRGPVSAWPREAAGAGSQARN